MTLTAYAHSYSLGLQPERSRFFPKTEYAKSASRDKVKITEILQIYVSKMTGGPASAGPLKNQFIKMIYMLRRPSS